MNKKNTLKKKLIDWRNGINVLTINTLNGSFQFNLQRFCNKDKTESTNFLSNQIEFLKHNRTIGLDELLCRHAKDVPYSKVVEIIKDVTGENQLSDQKISEIVLEKANEISVLETVKVRKNLIENMMPDVNIDYDIYSITSKEIMLQIDGILVKEQKAKRDNKEKEHKHFVTNTIALLQNKKNELECLVGSLQESDGSQASLTEIIQSKIIDNYKDSETPLNIIAINDGAKDIRKLLLSVFGIVIVVILDWFHLKKKVNEYMSMFGLTLALKKEKIKEVLHLLWHGDVEKAEEYLKSIDVKKTERRDELIEYLNKHKSEIINYEKRSKTGKTIGSGSIENGVNQIVGRRQKNKGMSWRPKGSKALAILKSIEFNNKWNDLWTLKNAA